jgi:hypothetical protein
VLGLGGHALCGALTVAELPRATLGRNFAYLLEA